MPQVKAEVRDFRNGPQLTAVLAADPTPQRLL